MPPQSFPWRIAQSYDYIEHLSVSDIAWEWLRRNADYRRDVAKVERPGADLPRLTQRVRLCWGLRFPGPTRV